MTDHWPIRWGAGVCQSEGQFCPLLSRLPRRGERRLKTGLKQSGPSLECEDGFEKEEAELEEAGKVKDRTFTRQLEKLSDHLLPQFPYRSAKDSRHWQRPSIRAEELEAPTEHLGEGKGRGEPETLLCWKRRQRAESHPQLRAGDEIWISLSKAQSAWSRGRI